jgi:tetratricopeptide (TPR) repeat protein
MKVLILILSLLTFYFSFGQKMPLDYFNEADEYFEVKKYDKALISYQYIVDNHPRNELFPRALYNTGYINFVQKDFKKAIEVFKIILESDFNEKEDLGGSIMDDPYTNYRHRASKIMSEIYFDKKNYELALNYFAISDTVFPYLHFCGNELASNEIYSALRYANIYSKLKQSDKAIEKLLPLIFKNLIDNSDVIKELKILLRGKKEIKQDFDNSLNKIYEKTIDKKDYTYTYHYINFLDVEIIVPQGFVNDSEEFDSNKAIEDIKQTAFYKMLESL